MYERFTDRARKVMQLANQESQRFNHEYLGSEHILLGLVKEGSGIAANVLKNLDIDLRKIRVEVEKLVQCGPEMVTMGKLPQTPRAKKVIEYSMEEARNLNHNYVGDEHILLGLLREQEGVAAQVLENLGLKLEEVREEVLNLLASAIDISAAERERKFSDLEWYRKVKRERFSQALSKKLEDDPLRLHPRLRPLMDQIRILDGQKRQAASNLEFEIAAALRDRQKRLQQRSLVVRESLSQSGSAASTDYLQRFCFPLDKPPYPTVREAEARQVSEFLARRETVCVVAPRGAGKTSLLQTVSQLVSCGAPGFENTTPIIVHPNHLRIWQEGQSGYDVPLRLMQELLRGSRHLLAVSDVDGCCSPRLPTALADAWKQAFRLAGERHSPLLLSCTEEALTRLSSCWPGLNSAWRLQRLQPIGECELLLVLQEQLKKLRTTHRLEVLPGFTEALVKGANTSTVGGVSADPGRTLMLLWQIIKCFAANNNSINERLVRELAAAHTSGNREKANAIKQRLVGRHVTTTLDELEREKEQAVDAHDFEKAATIRDHIDSIKKGSEGINNPSMRLGPEAVTEFLARES